MEELDDDLTDSIPLTNLITPEIPNSKPAKSSPESNLLKLVKRNDIAGVRQLFQDAPRTEHNDDRSAFIAAINRNYCDMIQCLLDLGLDPGDALYHAIETNSVMAVNTICDSLPESTREEILNRFPVSPSWPSTCKPLILAARQDNLKIVKTLIRHGAKMPTMEELRPRIADESYGQFIALLHWYEAVSGESYIMLTSDDPLETIFKLDRSLEELESLMQVPRFRQECDRIEAKLAALSTKLLGLARDDKEVELLLNGGEPEEAGKPKLPRRLRQALKLGFDNFVSHPSSQDYVVSQWEVSTPYVLRYAKSRVASAVLYLLLMVFFFVPCILYILLPVQHLRILKRPLVRFFLHLASRLYFLLFLILSTIRPRVVIFSDSTADMSRSEMTQLYLHYKARPWSPFLILIIIWIVGMTFRTIRDMWAFGPKTFLRNNGWNFLDLIQLVLYWIFIAMSLVAYIQAFDKTQSPGFFLSDSQDVDIGTPPNPETSVPFTPDATEQDSFYNFTDFFVWPAPPAPPAGGDNILASFGNQSRYDWSQFDPLLLAEAAFAVANVLTYLHLLHSLLILGFLGPLLISFRDMILDVAKFFIIFIFVTISFSLGLTQLYHTFEKLDLEACLVAKDKSECSGTPFLSFWLSMQSLFWSLFDLVDRDNLSVDDDLYFTQTVGTLMYATFMVVGVVVLLNALIAMMSNTYTRVEENSEVEWKVARTKLMGEYMTPSVTLPPPFNLIPSLKSILKIFQFFRRKYTKKSTGNQHSSHDHQTVHDTTAYKELSRALAERCLRATQMAHVKKTHKSKSKQEMAALKKSVDNIRFGRHSHLLSILTSSSCKSTPTLKYIYSREC
ncbi:transient-receptor-potential-like protein isoform X2 [Patiria miniata]|uniref:Transient receptor ion channel domain-containing protein n=1 Tax=Patiria miniata TaxID=46514 RepID=A0A914B2T6_PATMI|nr:transient-receptor-potential-like protein isoform X2 [Patiria miniata]